MYLKQNKNKFEYNAGGSFAISNGRILFNGGA